LANTIVQLRIFVGDIPFVESAQHFQSTLSAKKPKQAVDEFVPLGVSKLGPSYTQRIGHSPSNGLTNGSFAYVSGYPTDIAGACRIEQVEASTDVSAIILRVCPNNGYILAAGFLEAQIESVDLNALRVLQQADTGVSRCYVLKDGNCAVYTPAV
jgi:hypothetical protein